MGRQQMTSDAHFEVGDRVQVRGMPACVRMETATQVLVVFDHAEHQEEWVPKSSPALIQTRDPAILADQAAAAAAATAARAVPVDRAEKLSDEGEDDECCVRRPLLPPFVCLPPRSAPRRRLTGAFRRGRRPRVRRSVGTGASSRAVMSAPASTTFDAYLRPTTRF